MRGTWLSPSPLAWPLVCPAADSINVTCNRKRNLIHKVKPLLSAKFGTIQYVRIATPNIVTKWKLSDDIMNGD